MATFLWRGSNEACDHGKTYLKVSEFFAKKIIKNLKQIFNSSAGFEPAKFILYIHCRTMYALSYGNFDDGWAEF